MVTFFFFCVVLPLTIMVPEIDVPKWGAIYIPCIITTLNSVGTPRYLDVCKRHDVQPNSAVLWWFYKADAKKSINQKYIIEVTLDQLQDTDIRPLLDVLFTCKSEIEALTIQHTSSCLLNQDDIMSLIRGTNSQLRVLNLQNVSLSEDVFRELFEQGLACEVLNLRSTDIRKLNISGRSCLEAFTCCYCQIWSNKVKAAPRS